MGKRGFIQSFERAKVDAFKGWILNTFFVGLEDLLGTFTTHTKAMKDILHTRYVYRYTYCIERGGWWNRSKPPNTLFPWRIRRSNKLKSRKSFSGKNVIILDSGNFLSFAFYASQLTILYIYVYICIRLGSWLLKRANKKQQAVKHHLLFVAVDFCMSSICLYRI